MPKPRPIRSDRLHAPGYAELYSAEVMIRMKDDSGRDIFDGKAQKNEVLISAQQTVLDIIPGRDAEYVRMVGHDAEADAQRLGQRAVQYLQLAPFGVNDVRPGSQQ